MLEAVDGFIARDRCALCGEHRFVEVHTLHYAAADSEGYLTPAVRQIADAAQFRLCRCCHCGFHWTTPQPGPKLLSKLYQDTSEAYFDPLAEISPARTRLYRTAADAFRQRQLSGGRLLDLGCGTGEALRSFGGAFELFGVEPSRFAAECARQSTGARIHVGDLASAAYPSGFFDAVTAFDVLEHLPEPMETLREVRRVMRPGGVLVVETGDIDSLNARLAAAHWYYLLLPGHISFFSRRTLARALRASGYAEIASTRTHHGACGARIAAGYSRAMARHLLVSLCGARILALPPFRSRSTDYRIPFFYDHMLACAVAAG